MEKRLKEEEEETEVEIDVPDEFLCPLTLELMRDPVVSKYGKSFEREAIIKWLARGNSVCPLTRQPLRLNDLITNHQLRTRIRRWQVENELDLTLIAYSDEIPFVIGYIDIPDDHADHPEDDNFLIREQYAASARRSRVSRRNRASDSTRRRFRFMPFRRTAEAS